jgi:hypothetical protein
MEITPLLDAALFSIYSDELKAPTLDLYFEHVESLKDIYDFKDFIFYKNHLSYFETRKVNVCDDWDQGILTHSSIVDYLIQYCVGSDILDGCLQICGNDKEQLDFYMKGNAMEGKKLQEIDSSMFNKLIAVHLHMYMLEEIEMLKGEHEKLQIIQGRAKRLMQWRAHLNQIDTDLILNSI